MMDWETLKKTCHSCTRCGLCETRNHVVFGVGPQWADVMFVGEGPGEQEDLQGEPFVGPAGHLLDDMMSIIDLNRENSYIANMRNQVALIQPKILICLGRIAAKRIIDPEYRITRQHGTWVQKNGIWMTAIYHPSALLRDVSKRPETFEDLLSIRDKITEVGAKV